MRSKRQNPLPPKLAGWCCLERRRLEKIVQKPFGAKADEEAKRYAVRAGQRRRIQPITDGIGSDNGMLSEVITFAASKCLAGLSVANSPPQERVLQGMIEIRYCNDCFNSTVVYL